MQTISEYAVSRAEATEVVLKSIPEVSPFASKHVESLRADGRSSAVNRQLVREGQSSRRINSEALVAENAKLLDVDVMHAGLTAFREALPIAGYLHKDKLANPVNVLTITAQANATWDAIVSAMGRLADEARPMAVQTLAGILGRNLKELSGNSAAYILLGYEKAALLLLDHFAHATGWLEECEGEAKMMSRARKPNTYRLTPKFMSGVLGGDIAIDFSERRPMLVPPVPWNTSKPQGGYLHAPVPAVRGTNKPLGSAAVASALNALQGTGFRVNQRVLRLAETFTHNAESLHGSLVRGIYMERRHDTSEAVQQAKTIRSALTLSAMRELELEEEFYFPWNLDWRGRMYPATSIISPQGADLCKGCLEFADSAELGPEGAEALAVYLCNLAGADKEIVDGAYRTRTPAERVAWTQDHSLDILDVAADPFNVRTWHLTGGFGLTKLKRGKVVPVAVDKPWQFLAACFEWESFREQGIGFKSRLAGALDGSCSGVQMLAGMTRDDKAGAMVNLTPTERGDDYYGRMAQALDTRLRALVDRADDAQLEHLHYWSGQTMDRDLLKLPSMTKVYSAGTYTFAEQVKGKSGAPEEEAMWLAARINECFADVAPGMLAAMSYLQEVSDVMAAAGSPMIWTTPAGLKVEQARHAQYGVQIETRRNGRDTRRARMFTLYRDTLDNKLQRAGVAPNFVHGVDASHMVMTVNHLYAQGVRNFWMIHDSFGAPFAQCQAVFNSTREQFVNLMTPDLLQRWTDEVTANLTPDQKATLPKLPEYGDLDLNGVRDSVYAWY